MADGTDNSGAREGNIDGSGVEGQRSAEADSLEVQPGGQSGRSQADPDGSEHAPKRVKSSAKAVASVGYQSPRQVRLAGKKRKSAAPSNSASAPSVAEVEPVAADRPDTGAADKPEAARAADTDSAAVVDASVDGESPEKSVEGGQLPGSTPGDSAVHDEMTKPTEDQYAADAAVGEAETAQPASNASVDQPADSSDDDALTDVVSASDGAIEPVPSRTENVAKEMTLDSVSTFADFMTLLAQAKGEFKPAVLAKSSPARLSMVNAIDLAKLDDEIASVAARDLKLTTALSLMITADKSELSGFARQNATSLSARIVARHPAFAEDDAIQGRLTRLQSGDGDEQLLALLITRLTNRLDGDFDGKVALKTPSAVQTLQENAVHTVVLIAASAGKWNQLQLVDALAEHVWGAGSMFDTVTNREKLATLSKASRKAAALIVDTLRVRIGSVENDLAAERSRLDAAKTQNDALAVTLAESRRDAERLQSELNDAQTALQAEVSSRKSEKMAATDDFETLRVDTARNIAEQVESLEDALDALQHDQAKVTDEFVRRAVNNLRRGLARLQPRATLEDQGEQE